MSSMNWGALAHAWPYLLNGMATTLMLTAVTIVLGIVFGALLAVARMFGPPWLSGLSRLYVDTLRSIPLLLTIFWVFFLVPPLLRSLTGNDHLDVGPVYAAVTAFVLAEAAYFAEIIRGGIRSVRTGQMAAATALGMRQSTALRLIVLPQAFRNMMPSLVNQCITLFMDTSLVYVISLNDFLGAASKVAQRDGTLTEVYLFVALVYLAMCSLGAALVHLLQRRNAARA